MCTHLQRRGNRYFIRRRIPLDLITTYGRTEISRALGTSNYTEAKLRCRIAAVRLDDEFAAVRAGSPPGLAYRDVGALRGRTPAHTPASFEVAPQTVSEPPWGISLDDLADKWEAERQPDLKSKVMTRRVIKSFETLVSAPPAPAITRAHAVQFKDALLKSGQTGVNTNKYLTVFNVLLNYGVANGDIETNPARGVKVVVKRTAKDARHPFDLPALQAIFSSPIYTQGKIPSRVGHDAAYWIPLLALFYGARREELCQLRPEDVYEEAYLDTQGKEAKCWVLRITDSGEGQGVKTAASVRRVPIHAELIARGFLEFVERQEGNARLFSKLKADVNGVEGTHFGQWFNGSLRTAWGVLDRKMVFHSFRHSFKDHCRALEIPEEVSDALSGHSSGKVSRQYGGLSYPLRPLVEAVQRYRVPGLVLPPKP